MSHTPIPWKVSYDGNRILAKGSQPKGNGLFYPVATIDPDNVLNGPEDARLICTAVNCHAKLLGALKQAHNALVGSHAADDSVQGEARARAWSAIREAEEMLDKPPEPG